MKTPESYEKQAIKKYLDSIGAWHFSPYMAGFGKSGVPDIVGCYETEFFAIEVKREGAKLTPLQLRTLKKIEAGEAKGKTFWGTADKVKKDFEGWREVLASIWITW